MIKAQNLTIQFDERLLIKDLNFELGSSEIFCILGPNGAGKSTLLKTLLGLMPSAGGQVKWQDQDWLKIDPAQRAKIAAAVFSETHVHGPITLLDFISLGNSLSKADRFNLLKSEFANLNPSHLFNSLSDGEKQRLSLLRALCQNPEVLYLDEPTSHLDPFYTLDFLEKIKSECSQQHRSFVWSTHRWNFALQHAHKVLILWGNGKWWLGTPIECRHQKILEELASYKGMQNTENLNWF